MVALEYCITYEVSPPPWLPPQCSYLALGEAGGAVDGDDSGMPPVLPTTTLGSADFNDSDMGVRTLAPGLATAPVSLGVLSGMVLGDASAVLAVVDARAGGSDLLVVACDTLTRIDFSAAGSVLNWAAEQQAAGRSVHFTGLHRLAAIFFNVIGINENAKVIPRRN